MFPRTPARHVSFWCIDVECRMAHGPYLHGLNSRVVLSREEVEDEVRILIDADLPSGLRAVTTSTAISCHSFRVRHMPGVMPHVGPAVARAVCQRRVEGRLHSRDARRAHEQAWGARRHACTCLRRMPGEANHASFMPGEARRAAGRAAGGASRQCAGCGEISARFGYSAVHWLHRTPTALAGALPRSATARSMVSRAAYGVS